MDGKIVYLEHKEKIVYLEHKEKIVYLEHKEKIVYLEQGNSKIIFYHYLIHQGQLRSSIHHLEFRFTIPEIITSSGVQVYNP